eukprot:3726671-Rhodomonas_salina.1
MGTNGRTFVLGVPTAEKGDQLSLLDRMPLNKAAVLACGRSFRMKRKGQIMSLFPIIFMMGIGTACGDDSETEQTSTRTPPPQSQPARDENSAAVGGAFAHWQRSTELDLSPVKIPTLPKEFTQEFKDPGGQTRAKEALDLLYSNKVILEDTTPGGKQKQGGRVVYMCENSVKGQANKLKKRKKAERKVAAMDYSKSDQDQEAAAGPACRLLIRTLTTILAVDFTWS